MKVAIFDPGPGLAVKLFTGSEADALAVIADERFTAHEARVVDGTPFMARTLRSFPTLAEFDAEA